MRRILLFVLLLSPALSFAAGEDYKNVLSAVTLDLDADGGFDRAVLEDDGNGAATLYIYASKFDQKAKEFLPMSLQLVRRDMAWMGSMWGQIPSLEVNSNGRLLIKAGNDSIGRGRWQQTVEVTFDSASQGYIVSALTYMSRDTLDLDAGGSCEIDFLKGEAKRNGKSVPYDKQVISISAWNNDVLPTICTF